MVHKKADKDNHGFKCIACSIFKKELEELVARGKLPLDFIYISSMLHLEPPQLEKVIREKLKNGDKNLLIFGNCCTTLCDLSSFSNAFRTVGENCCEIVLGKKMYEKLSRERAFFLMPEWVDRWEQIFIKEFGLSSGVAQDLLKESTDYFLYLDTGVHPVPTETLDKISSFFKIPWKIKKIDIEQDLLDNILKACALLNKE